MTESGAGARRREGGYLFVRKGARRVSIDEALPGRSAAAPEISALLSAQAVAGSVRAVRPVLDPAAVDPRLCFFLHPGEPICDAYRGAATELLAQAGDARRLLVTSPRRRAGRTLTAINLASALAERERVLLVDLHRMSPGVARAFGLPRAAGLVDAMRQRRRNAGGAVDVTLLADRLSALCIEPDAPPGTLDVNTLKPLLELVGTSADRVVIDGPPVLDDDQVLGLAVLADAVVLVVEPDDLASGDYERTIERLDGRRIAGTLINDLGNRRPIDVPVA